MRRLVHLFLAVLAVAAEETRVVSDASGRISVTVPSRWTQRDPASPEIVLDVRAPGAYGGHSLTVVREAGQADRGTQRTRYLTHDSASAPNSAVRQVDTPYFGYRIDDAERNRVFLRAFIADGADGLVLTVSSRYQLYDRYWAAQIEAVAASLTVSAAGAPRGVQTEGAPRRHFDRRGTVSFVVPGAWQRLRPDSANDLLLIALKGISSGPRFTLTDWGGPSNAALTLVKISGQWKSVYANMSVAPMGADPPGMLVRGRLPGSVDYLLAFDCRDRGYTLGLTVREEDFERHRTVADRTARTLVFLDAAYDPPEPPAGTETRDAGEDLVVHAEQEATAERVARAVAGFPRAWDGIRIRRRKDAPPLRLLVVSADAFAEAGHHFGRPPAAYDRQARLVVAVSPPPEGAAPATWRGPVYAALAESAMHRDLAVPTPPWLLAGLALCMDAAGRSDDDPAAPHAALADLLAHQVGADAHRAVGELLGTSYADLFFAETPDWPATAWGYTHLLLFGRGTAASQYRRWRKQLAGAEREAPVLAFGDPDKVRDELRRHAERSWGS